MYTTQRYRLSVITLHWLIAVLVLVLIGMGWYMTDLPKRTPAVTYFYNLHKSIGICAAVLILLQIILRIRNAPPPFPVTLPVWQARLARLGHTLLYISLVVMPLSGFIASNSRKFGIKFFGYQLQPLLPDNPAVYHFFNTLHEFTSDVLVALLAAHVLGVVVHLFDKSRIFRRMWFW